MEDIKFMDITEQVFALSKCKNFQVLELQGNQTYDAETFNLHDSMSATEIDDYKMDYKYDLKNSESLDSLIQKGLVKQPKDLEIKDIVGLFDQLMRRFMTWNKGFSLTESYLTFCYFYDPELVFQQNKLLNAIIEAFHYLFYVYTDLLRSSSLIKEEDQIFSFIVQINGQQEINSKSFDYIMENLKQFEISKKKKKQTDLNINVALDERIKLLKNFCQIFQQFNKKEPSVLVFEKIDQIRQQAIKNLNIVQLTCELGTQNLDSYFNNTMTKQILCLMSVRKYPKIFELDQTFELIDQFLNELNNVNILQRQDNITTIFDMLYNIGQKSLNITKIFIEICLFKNQGVYFGQKDYTELITNYMKNFGLEYDESNEEIQNFIQKFSILIQDQFHKVMKNSYRQYRDFSNSYGDLSVLVHDSTQIQKSSNTPFTFLNLSYEICLRNILKQLQKGFEIELFEPLDYPFVLFYMDYAFQIYENNGKNYIQSMDKQFLMAFKNKQDYKNKKKITDFQRRFFYNSIFQKGIQQIVKPLSVFIYFLATRNYMSAKYVDDDYLKKRYQNRMKIFDQIYFIQKYDFETFKETFDKFLENENFLQRIKQMFEEAKQLFKQLIDMNLDIQFDYDLQHLMRLCVMNGMAVTKFEIFQKKNENLKNKIKVTNIRKEIVGIPTIDISLIE